VIQVVKGDANLAEIEAVETGWRTLWFNDLSESFATRRDQFEQLLANGRSTEAHEAAIRFVFDICHFTRDLCGENMMKIAHSYPTASGEETDPLLLLWKRLGLVAHLASCPQDTYFKDMLDELITIASGDAPYFFARRGKSAQSESAHGFRLQWLKLEALKWAAFLKSSGMRSIDYQYQIANAFGRDWGTIAKWKAECTKRLSKTDVDDALARARRFGQHSRGQDQIHFYVGAARIEHPTVAQAGEAFRALSNRCPKV